ncbi:cation acetate symporter [Burkholderia sp. 22PA0099]|uniref:solute symporter family protein n=1 Tax=Burkholderia sp. 22PA0099 TaxID=3237372 RepID=UPI0039C3BB50
MKRHARSNLLPWMATCTAALLFPALAHAADVVPRTYRPHAFAIFAAVIALTLIITGFSARRRKSATEFYTAGGGISGLKNGLAIAGDYLSAAAFLGVSGLIALYGYDGMLYLVGFFAALIPVLLLVAEPCRNLGRYTFGDILAYRHSFRTSKVLAAFSSVIVAIFYMIPQIVGGAVLLYALLGVPYEVSVLAVGGLMLLYVTVGGMRATTWVQIIKAGLLLGMCGLLAMLAIAPFGFNVSALLDGLSHQAALHDWLLASHRMTAGDGTLLARTFFEPGLYLKDPVELLSLGLALTLGTAAMPHILMRMFSVKNAQTARKSVLWAMLWIGGCHMLIIVIGFAAAYYVGAANISAADKGGNLAALLLAQHLGGGASTAGGNLLLGVMAAIAFVTIVAVVAGLTLAAASSLAHDVYVGALKGGHASDREQVMAGKVASVLVAFIATGAGLFAKGQNVAHLVGLAFAVAASANLPALLATLYWKRCNTTGVVASVVGGAIVTISLVLVSPNMQYPLAVRTEASRALAASSAKLAALEAEGAARYRGMGEFNAARDAARASRDAAQATLDTIGSRTTSLVGLREPLVSLRNPGIVSVPLGFLFVVIGSLLGRRRGSDAGWRSLVFRRDSGTDVAHAIDH